MTTDGEHLVLLYYLYTSFPEPEEAFERSLVEGGPAVVAGSFYLVGAALDWLSKRTVLETAR